MFFHELTFAGSRESCLNTRPLGRVFRYLPRDRANVIAATMDDRCFCITYDSKANCDENAPKLHINSI